MIRSLLLTAALLCSAVTTHASSLVTPEEQEQAVDALFGDMGVAYHIATGKAPLILIPGMENHSFSATDRLSNEVWQREYAELIDTHRRSTSFCFFPEHRQFYIEVGEVLILLIERSQGHDHDTPEWMTDHLSAQYTAALSAIDKGSTITSTMDPLYQALKTKHRIP